MKILVLDPQDGLAELVARIEKVNRDLEIITTDSNGRLPSAPLVVDIIVANGALVSEPSYRECLLGWRTHPETHLIPCWISSTSASFDLQCLWPRLSVDVIRKLEEPHAFQTWIGQVAEWQQNRTTIEDQGSLASRTPLEFSNALALRKASGVLKVFGRADIECMLAFKNGCLVDARMKHLSGAEAFFDFFCWSDGAFLWEPSAPIHCTMEPQPLPLLTQEALRLVQDANLLFHFAPDLHRKINRTSSESALDDGAIAHFTSIKEIYALINGRFTIAEILDASPLSPPRTMSCLAKWFSLGDVSVVPEERPAGSCRVLIVDDSPFMCKTLSAALSKDPAITVLGEAHDGIEALKLIDELNPDVVTLDLQMPRMDGLTALKHIMIRNAKPVVVLSAFTPQTSPLTYQSFKLGAVDVLTKPSQKSDQSLRMEQKELCRHVLEAGAVRIEAAQYIRPRKSKSGELGMEVPAFGASQAKDLTPRGVVVILSGVGGFAALVRLLLSIGRTDLPHAVVACLDMPSSVVEALLPNVEKDSALSVEILRAKRTLKAGRCYLCSRESQWILQMQLEGITADIVSTHDSKRQSFDLLLNSASECFGPNTLAVLLSGNGTDGLAGMKVVKDGGGSIYALSPDACLKPDLPKRVIEGCGAQEVGRTAEMACIIEQID